MKQMKQMRRMIAVGVGSLCLAASAGTPPSKAAAQPGKGPSGVSVSAAPESGYSVTLEKLDQYIRYRQESDPRQQQALKQSLRQLQAGGSVDMMAQMRQLRVADLELREKHGLSEKDFLALDRMVRDICDARFMAESPMAKALVQRNEQNAAAATGEQAAMSRAMAKLTKKQMEEGPTLREQRMRYGDANVDTVLLREKELKQLWAAKEALAAEALESMP